MRNLRHAIGAVLPWLVLCGNPAAAETLVDATDPEAILNVARGFGSASLETDDSGDPKIAGRIDGIRYSLYFYGCKAATNCQSLQFKAGWTGSSATLETVNDWNLARRYGSGYIDKEGDPVVKMDVNIEFGVSARNLDETFALWKSVLGAFADDVVNAK